MDNKFTDQEKQLRDLSENFSLDIDTAELWDKVESQLPPAEDERRRPLVWWYASGAILILAGFMLWNLQSDTNKKALAVDDTLNISSSTIIENPTHSDTKHIQKSPEKSNNSTSQVSEDKTSIKDRPIASSIEPNVVSKNKPSNAKPKKVISRSIFNSNRYDEKSSIRNEVVINQGPVEQKSIASLVNPSSESERTENNEVVRQDRSFVSVASISSRRSKWSEKEIEFDLPMKEIKPLKSAYWLPYLAFSSGVNIHRSEISSNTSEGLNLSQFDEERPIPGMSSDLRFGFENASGWRFGLGLNHSRLVNRYSLAQPDTSVRSIQGNVSSTIDDQGNVSNLNGELLQTTITNYDVNWHRVHDLVSLQLHVGKRIIRKGKFSLYTDLSVGRNIWAQHSGYYFTKEGETINKFSSDESSPYSNSGYNLGLSMDLEYKINEFSISLKPFTLHGLNSMTQNSNYYQIKNSQYGVQLGIVYRP